MLDMEVTHEYRDNRPEFKRRLAEDLAMKSGKTTDQVTEAVAILIDHGFAEMDSLREKYNDLICPWCGRLHYRVECQAQLEKHLISPDTTVPDGFDPYAIFYDSGSVGLKTELSKLGFEELKAVLVKYTTLSKAKSADKYARGILIDLIVREVKNRCHQGVAFGDYKLPE